MRISPRQLADAIGVSESSLKRWADAGKLTVTRTEGGHRRIAMTEAVRFIRDSGATVVRPDLLGLDDGAPGKRRAPRMAFAPHVRAQLVGRFLGGESIAALADGVIAEALANIVTLRERAARDAKSEIAARAATDALVQAIAALRGLCDVPADAPLAIGGAAPGGGGRGVDALRSAVVAAVLAGEGLRVIDLGADLSPTLQRTAAAAHTPAITWLVDGDTIDLDGYRARTLAEVAAYARGRQSGSASM